MEDITEGTSDLHHLASRDVPANVTKADIISTVEFDHTGNYLATGDKGGRVVLFERNETVCRLLDSLFRRADIPAEKVLRVQIPHRVPVP